MIKWKKKINRKIEKTDALLVRRINKFINFKEEKIKKILGVFSFFCLIVLFILIIVSENIFDRESRKIISVIENSNNLESDIQEMVSGYPIEVMTPMISRQDKIVAAFLISIAKKESNWGKRSPILNGVDCYNYWGFRQKRDRMGSGGHTCFDSPRDAVLTVSDRIREMIEEQNLDTPEKMIVWKCGYSCDGHSQYGVRKWIDDVGYYFEKIYN